MAGCGHIGWLCERLILPTNRWASLSQIKPMILDNVAGPHLRTVVAPL